MPLDPMEITRKDRLTSRYSSFHKISRRIALDILNNIGQEHAADSLENLIALCANGQSDERTDITTIQNNGKLDRTTKEILIQARLGQGKFRSDLMGRWGNSCAVTGCAIPELLRASHIIPWREANNTQRLDPDNGLLLVANLDALFDSWLISFEDTGRMIVSGQVAHEERARLGIPQPLRQRPNAAQREYLSIHRQQLR